MSKACKRPLWFAFLTLIFLLGCATPALDNAPNLAADGASASKAVSELLDQVAQTESDSLSAEAFFCGSLPPGKCGITKERTKIAYSNIALWKQAARFYSDLAGVYSNFSNLASQKQPEQLQRSASDAVSAVNNLRSALDGVDRKDISGIFGLAASDLLKIKQSQDIAQSNLALSNIAKASAQGLAALKPSAVQAYKTRTSTLSTLASSVLDAGTASSKPLFEKQFADLQLNWVDQKTPFGCMPNGRIDANRKDCQTVNGAYQIIRLRLERAETANANAFDEGEAVFAQLQHEHETLGVEKRTTSELIESQIARLNAYVDEIEKYRKSTSLSDGTAK